ncbi:MAG: LPP20 family lipoprotein [Gammaproteobacteria bacterium]|nr:LPP20 family lipoprotein [Gammaproteobacteria bacterium]MDH5730075.1 LPP20 family lipoprotein [Gammaproteobacteria bacterium]
MLRIFSLIVVISVALAGCSSAPKKGGKPDWVDGNSAKYSNTMYLTGRGQAGGLAVAQDRARSDLAKILEVQVQERSSDTTTFKSSTFGDMTQSQGSLDVSRQVKTQTRKVVKGIQIADTWKDSSGQYHALAVLSRMQAGNAMKKEIEQFDGSTRSYINKAKQSNDSLAKMAYIFRALEAQTQRHAIQQMLQVVDSSGKGVPSPFNLGELTAELDAAARSMKFKTSAIGDETGQTQPILAGALSKAQFSESADGGDFTLEGNLKMNPGVEREGWLWVRATYSVRMLDSKGGVRGNKHWSYKISAQEQSTATMRLMEKITKTLDDELAGTIIGFAISQ